MDKKWKFTVTQIVVGSRTGHSQQHLGARLN